MSIPSTHSEIEQLFVKVELANTHSTCITSCQAGEGVTSLAMALTERYLLAGYKTLFVDLNLHRPGFNSIELLSSESASSESADWITHSTSLRCFHGLPVPTNPHILLSYKNPHQLKQQVDTWLTRYDRVVIDTSPLLNINRGNIPAQVVASACDSTVLSVLSSVTNKQQLSKSLGLLDLDQIRLIGTVMNAYQQPTLVEELCREVSRLGFLPNSWQCYLHKKIKHNPFLTIPI